MALAVVLAAPAADAVIDVTAGVAPGMDDARHVLAEVPPRRGLQDMRVEERPGGGERTGGDDAVAEGRSRPRHTHGVRQTAAFPCGLIRDGGVGDLRQAQHDAAFGGVALKARELITGQDIGLVARVQRRPRMIGRRHGDEAERYERKAQHDGQGDGGEEPCQNPGHRLQSGGGGLDVNDVSMAGAGRRAPL
jgi:hypothetical protein